MAENTRKSVRVVTWIGLAAVVVTVGLQINGRLNDLHTRVVGLEADLRVLRPLVSVMSGHRPGPGVEDPYHAVQATGAPNVTSPGTDSPLAWCPAVENGGTEWLELRYEPPVTAAGIQIHATFNPGAIVRVLVGGEGGPLREITVPAGPPLGVQTLSVSPATELSRVRLELDTSKVPGWNEIDAVALLDAAGLPTWAASATASSVWGQAPGAE